MGAIDDNTTTQMIRDLKSWMLAGAMGGGGGNSGFKIETDDATTSDNNNINIGITPTM